MPRIKRVCPAGEAFHVLNRAVARMTIFEKEGDYQAFLQIVDEVRKEIPIAIYAMTALPNHWYFVVSPTTDDQLSEFFRRLTVTRTMQLHATTTPVARAMFTRAASSPSPFRLTSTC